MARLHRVDEIRWKLSTPEREALDRHLRGGTSTRVIAATLTANGYPIGASSIKRYLASQRTEVDHD